MKPSLKINGAEFQATLREYMAVTKRSLAYVLNQKGFSVAIAASKLTAKADKAKIASDLNAAGQGGAPIAALIINKALKEGGARGKRISKIVGEPMGRGLFGAKMKEAVRKFIASRRASSAFLRSGWLPGVAVFAKAIGKSPAKNAARAFEKRKYLGSAAQAKPGINPVASFWNTAAAPEESKTGEGKSNAEEGLAEALAQQTADMRVYIERKMQRDADKLMRRFLR